MTLDDLVMVQQVLPAAAQTAAFAMLQAREARARGDEAGAKGYEMTMRGAAAEFMTALEGYLAAKPAASEGAK